MGEQVSAGAAEGAPVAGTLAVQIGDDNGHPVVLLVETGAISQHTTKMTPEVAESTAELLTTGARRARLGLVLPPGT